MNTVPPIRVASLQSSPTSLDCVVRWIHDEWAAYSGRTHAQTRARFADEPPSGTLPHSLVALDGDTPVGLATLREQDSVDWDPTAKPWVCNVYVTPAARGRGVARLLCNGLEALAAKMGYSMLYLGCTSEQRSLYERLGYTTYRVDERLAYPVYLMRLPLTKPGDLAAVGRPRQQVGRPL